MDALTLLKQDHDKVRALFKEVQALGERATTSRRALFERIDEELTLHSKLEEKLFYPAVKQHAEDSEQREEVLEAYEEHAVAKRLIKELEGMEPTDERYKAKLNVLIEAVEHHATEEEKEMFKTAKEVLSREELEDIGEKIIEGKEKAGAAVSEEAMR